MTLVRRLARPMLASVFVSEGYSALRSPASRVPAASPFIAQMSGPLHLPDDPELLVRANGAAMLGAGTLYGLGRFPRLSALVLFLTMLPQTYTNKPFWAEKEPDERAAKRSSFLRNVSLLGAALLASVDTEGRPGLAWRAQRAGKDVRRSATLTGKQARAAARTARRQAKLARVVGASKLPGVPGRPSMPSRPSWVARSGPAGSSRDAGPTRSSKSRP